MTSTGFVERDFATFWRFAALGIATLLPTFGMSIANVALPTFSLAFSAQLTTVQWVVSAYLLALTLFSIVAGRVADSFGAKPSLLFGYAIFLLGAFLCWSSQSLWMLIVGRVVQGTGAAFLAVVAIALAKQSAKDNSVGRAMGLLGTMTAVGTALGPSVGGLVIEFFGWRALFALLGIFGILGALMSVCVLSDVGKEKTRMVHAESPKAKLAKYIAPAIANSLVAVIMMTTFIAGPFYLTYVLGYSEGAVGLVMAIGPLISILSGFPSGMLVDRIGANRVTQLGLGFVFCGALAFVFLPATWTLAGYVIALIVLTPGYQLFLSANNTALMNDVADSHRGFVSGLLNMSRNAGLIVGATAIAAVFTIGAGTSILANAAAESIGAAFQLVFLINAGLIVVAFMALRIGNAKR